MQELTSFNLSRRKFCLFVTSFISLNILIPKSAHATNLQNPTLFIEELVGRTELEPSFVRLGKWMQEGLLKAEILEIIKQAEEQLQSSTIFFQSRSAQAALTKMISNDYLQGRIVNISDIRFSVLEVALCLTVATDINREVG